MKTAQRVVPNLGTPIQLGGHKSAWASMEWCTKKEECWKYCFRHIHTEEGMVHPSRWPSRLMSGLYIMQGSN